MAQSAIQAKDYLVGGSRQSGEEDLIFLKNAMGHEIQFTVERGGGARAQLLASKKRRLRKLMDAAASRVGVSLPLYIKVQEEENRKRKQAEDEEKERLLNGKKGKTSKIGYQTLEFLADNIGRLGESIEDQHRQESDDETPEEDVVDPEGEMVLCDETAELRQMSDENRLASFQAQYKLEVDRQEQLLESAALESPRSTATEEGPPLWEDGDLL